MDENERKWTMDSWACPGETIAEVRFVAFWPFCQSSPTGLNPLLTRVCGFKPVGESWQNHPKIDRIGTSAIVS